MAFGLSLTVTGSSRVSKIRSRYATELIKLLYRFDRLRIGCQNRQAYPLIARMTPKVTVSGPRARRPTR
ncbi:hypothetical protein D3C73_1221200 [compost metagenome]